MQRMMELRERGISPIGINCYPPAHIKAYLRWMVQEGHIAEAPKNPVHEDRIQGARNAQPGAG